MQFILENNLYDKANLITTCKKRVKIKFLGIPNLDQGPDFLQSRILIDHTEWAGNIELHVNTSDWNSHRHHLDKNYINVILHIVWRHDTDRFLQSYVLVLSDFVDRNWQETYLDIKNKLPLRPCEYSHQIPYSFQVIDWLNLLSERRLERKVQKILSILKSLHGDWEEVAWRTIASNFGYRVNYESFYQLACSIPFRFISRFKGDHFSIESLLMGQAGLLEGDFNDNYPIQLKSTYSRFKKNFFLTEMSQPIHFLRMRPQNFPTIRLSQLATFFSKVKSVFELIEKTTELTDLSFSLRFSAAKYWDDHYSFDRTSKLKIKQMGNDFTHNLILNSFIPLMIAYGLSKGENSCILKARKWLYALPPEINKKVSFLKHVVDPKNAFQSQSLIELSNNFCEANRCYECFIATELRSIDRGLA